MTDYVYEVKGCSAVRDRFENFIYDGMPSLEDVTNDVTEILKHTIWAKHVIRQVAEELYEKSYIHNFDGFRLSITRRIVFRGGGDEV